mmetsp:Transcript_6088/g.25213  ORF Transcript_6088/g.25213 Transcript_6088/m.25213 type:complete len:256 (-) Transcript_6088:1348-2115(-)
MDTLSMLSKLRLGFFRDGSTGRLGVRRRRRRLGHRGSLRSRGALFGLLVRVEQSLRRGSVVGSRRLLGSRRRRLGLLRSLFLGPELVLLELAIGDLLLDELLLLLQELELPDHLFLARGREVALLRDGHDHLLRKTREGLLDLLERDGLALLRRDLVEVHGGVPRDVARAHRRGLLHRDIGLCSCARDRKRPGEDEKRRGKLALEAEVEPILQLALEDRAIVGVRAHTPRAVRGLELLQRQRRDAILLDDAVVVF